MREKGEGNLVVGEVEPELHGLRKKGSAVEDFPHRSAHLDEGIDGHNGVRREHEPGV